MKLQHKKELKKEFKGLLKSPFVTLGEFAVARECLQQGETPIAFFLGKNSQHLRLYILISTQRILIFDRLRRGQIHMVFDSSISDTEEQIKISAPNGEYCNVRLTDHNNSTEFVLFKVPVKIASRVKILVSCHNSMEILAKKDDLTVYSTIDIKSKYYQKSFLHLLEQIHPSISPIQASLMIKHFEKNGSISLSEVQDDNVMTLRINAAQSVDELCEMGLSRRQAELLLEYKGLHGEFRQLSDLLGVKWIGERTLMKMSPTKEFALTLNKKKKKFLTRVAKPIPDTKEFFIPIVYGVIGREQIENNQLWEILHDWGSSIHCQSYYYREQNRGFISFMISAFREDETMERWRRLISPQLSEFMIDGWMDYDRDYVMFITGKKELCIIGVNKTRGEATKSAVMHKMEEEINRLEEMLTPYNEREGIIQAGARNMAQIEALSPLEFESFVAELFRKRGWTVTLTKKSGDTGIDIIMRQGSSKAIVQCKKWGKNVGQPVIRDVLGAMIHEGADKAYVVTTGGFTKAAISFCEGKPIHLVDRVRIMEWVGKNEG